MYSTFSKNKSYKGKAVLIFGGTGFIGKSFIQEGLKLGYYIIVVTRSETVNEAIKTLSKNNFPQDLLAKSLKTGKLLFILGFPGGIGQEDKFRINLDKFNDFYLQYVFNFSGSTTGTSKSINYSHTFFLSEVIDLIRYVKKNNPEIIFINMGSTAEKKVKDSSVYGKSKAAAREIINKSRMCDLQIIIQYAKGRGERKMTQASDSLWKKLRISHKWLFGFSVSVIDVDELASIVFAFLKNHLPLEKNGVKEIYVTNGHIVFGEMINLLLPIRRSKRPRKLIPNFLEDLFLATYAKLVNIFYKNNVKTQRLASFARRAINASPELDFSMMTPEKIMSLHIHEAGYEVIRKEPFYLVANKERDKFFALSHKEENELRKIISRSSESNF